MTEEDYDREASHMSGGYIKKGWGADRNTPVAAVRKSIMVNSGRNTPIDTQSANSIMDETIQTSDSELGSKRMLDDSDDDAARTRYKFNS